RFFRLALPFFGTISRRLYQPELSPPGCCRILVRRDANSGPLPTRRSPLPRSIRRKGRARRPGPNRAISELRAAAERLHNDSRKVSRIRTNNKGPGGRRRERLPKG